MNLVVRLSVSLLILTVLPQMAAAVPIVTLPGLTSVSFYEATFVVTEVSYAPAAPQLLIRLADPLTDTNNDFFFFPNEDYDVFYSDASGAPVATGEYLTIEGVWRQPSPGFGGGGMNITGVELDFAAAPSILADFVASFVFGSQCAGGGCVPGSEALAVDGDLSFSTIPRFGGTDPTPNSLERFRLTVGFTGISDAPAPVPEPGSLTLLTCALVAGLFRSRRL